jgi:GDP-4-dehydro-6-deoxy-D-mannose reductase
VRRLLVTGRHGFVGNSLARRIAEAHAGSWALCNVPPTFDLCERGAASALVVTECPDAVVHLAAQSAVQESIDDPEGTLRVNILGTLHLLQALSDSDFRGRMLYVGSGDVYGHVPDDALPVAESWMPRPRNPYAVSKLAAEALCWQWHVQRGLDVVLARPFNHIGHGQSSRFVVSSLARQIVQIVNGRQEPRIRAGNLDVTRDFTDVRDVADAYLALLVSGQSGDIYNVCSGIERSIGSLLGRLVEIAGVSASIEQEQARMRPGEQLRMRGDPSKLVRTTGWQPRIPIEASLRDALCYWEERLDG